MCLADLYDFTPEQRASIASVEWLRAMREVVRRERSFARANVSMPANAGNANPCAELAAAGSYIEERAA